MAQGRLGVHSKRVNMAERGEMERSGANGGSRDGVRPAPAVLTRGMMPHDREAEQGVLGAIIHENRNLERVIGVLDAEAFFSPGHRRIFQAMLGLREQQTPIDETTLAAKLRLSGGIDHVGGVSYIAELVDLTPVAGNIEVYVEIVLERHRARSIVQLALDVVSDVMESGVVTDHAARLRAALEQVDDQAGGLRGRPFSQAGMEFCSWLGEEGKPAFVARTHTRLDGMLGGIGTDRPGYIASRTGVGKTTFALQTAIRNAKAGVPALFV